MITRLIRTLFLLLFFLLPLLVSSVSSELFELPKMYFLYLVTILLSALHFINVILKNQPLTKSHPLHKALLIFFLFQTLAFFFSIDHYASFFGYYGRFNGGILSLISYLLLFLILHVYQDSQFQHKIIRFSLFSGFLVSLYAIAQHFGIDKHLWVQDVQARVFSTLGQPNWLSAYLAILIPFSFFTKKKFTYLLLVIFSLALVFTKSKTGLFSAFLIYLLYFFHTKKYLLAGLLIIISTSTGLYFFLSKPQSPPVIDGETLIITQSEDIRKLVWTGAINLVKQYPLLGTGQETFGQTYYWTRPPEHNLTSEWNYLYNKAHNEYLNYAATTGLLGLAGYLLLIYSQLKFTFHRSFYLFLSLLGILINNLTGFSVVTVSLYFFLLPLLCPESS